MGVVLGGGLGFAMRCDALRCDAKNELRVGSGRTNEGSCLTWVVSCLSWGKTGMRRWKGGNVGMEEWRMVNSPVMTRSQIRR